MFDFIDHKEQVHALYGIFFSFLNDEKLVRRTEKYTKFNKISLN